ncbi:MAG: sensor histidine kinase, partial [Saprospiraceae bacterium]
VRAQKIGLWFLAGILAVLGYLLYKNIQQKSEIKVQNQTIQKSLEDKDILLREIHHRVKNNLQVVSSLLNLQSSYISDKIALEAINEGKNRVSSMALIHQNLYTEKNLTEIETKRYFEELLDQLFDSYNIDSDSISLEKDIDSVLLDVDMMIPLGLITNELISNALKHAFINRKTGTVFFKLKKMEEKLLITISDNGSGMSAKQFLESDSFGNKLIHAFVQKLKGSMDIESNNGTQITLNLNIKTPAA